MRSAFSTSIALCLALLPLAGCGHTVGPMATAREASRAHVRAASPDTLFVEPQAGTTPILQAIQAARKSIQVELYMFTDQGAPAALIQALAARAKAGVKVQVMLDPKPYTGPTTGTNPNLPAAQALQAAGIAVKDASPRFTYTHEKAMVVDGTTAVIMTCNWTNGAFTHNREYGVVDTNPTDVAEVAAVFQADWNQAPITPTDPNLVVSPDNSRQRLITLIDSARKTLVLQDEEFQDPEIAQHLGARAKAGVDVRVELGAGQGSQAEQQQLAAAGVTQVEFMSSLTLHAKAIVVDGARAYIGSENMTANSLDHNREMGLILQDPAAVATLVSVTSQDWNTK